MIDQVLTVNEAAVLVRCHRQTITRAIKAEDLPAAKLNRAYRISRGELARWWRGRGGGNLFEAIPSPASRAADLASVLAGSNERARAYALAEADATEDEDSREHWLAVAAELASRS